MSNWLIDQILRLLIPDPTEAWVAIPEAGEMEKRLKEVARQFRTDDEFTWEWFYGTLLEWAGRKATARGIAQELAGKVDFYITEIRGYRFADQNPLPGADGQTLLLQGEAILRKLLPKGEVVEDAVRRYLDPTEHHMMKGIRGKVA